jgi:hypothetical protein
MERLWSGPGGYKVYLFVGCPDRRFGHFRSLGFPLTEAS